MSTGVLVIVDGAAAPAGMAQALPRQLARFGVPHAVVDLRDMPVEATWPAPGIAACLADGDMADRLCRRFSKQGVTVLRPDPAAEDPTAAAAMAGRLGGLLDQLGTVAAPAA